MNKKLQLFWRNPTPEKPKVIDIPEGFSLKSNNKELLKPLEDQYNDYIVTWRIINTNN